MSGPADRRPDGKCVRKDGHEDGRSQTALPEPRDTQYPFRVSFSMFGYLQKVRRELGFRSRADMIEEAVDFLDDVEKAAVDLNYRSRRDVLDDALASLRFVHKAGPLPACAKLGETPLIKGDRSNDQPNLL